METVLLSSSDADLIKAAELIRSGEIVGIPTETVYGLAADARNPDAVMKIFKAKGRPADNPLIVHIADIIELEQIAHNIPDLAYKIAEKFWPGPLTIVLDKNDVIPDVTSGGLNTVGVRMPSNVIANKLIKLSGCQIAAPSANKSGYPSPTSAEHVINDMNGIIPAVVNGGDSLYGVESTVISFDDDKTIRILRPGFITRSDLLEVTENVIIDDAILHDISPDREAPSPGMKYKHYSPKANVVLVEGTLEEYCRYVNKHAGNNTYALIYDCDVDNMDITCQYETYGSSSREQAHNIFSKLRSLDEKGADNIIVRSPSKEGVGLAVYNRLLRSAGFEVISL